MELTNSKRLLRSASYVMTELTEPEQQREEERHGRALEKINFIRQAGLTAQDVGTALEKALRPASNVPLPPEQLRDGFGALARIVERLAGARPQEPTNLALAPLAKLVPGAVLIEAANSAAERLDAFMSAGVQVDIFKKRMRTAPVGRIHLERLEMFPAGIERGELVFTVPLAPKETITISHKEWSLSGEEYERIVQDYFEQYSERGVAEKTDVSMSTENDSRHSSAFNFSASVSGGYGPVSMTVGTGLNLTSDYRQAVKESVQRSREVTEKASARTRKEHKVSVKLETKRGVEDSSFRTITNADENKAIRIDYFRMMRKWRTEQYRYGLRLTFDVAIPNPGARLWALYRKVRELDAAIRRPFVFTLKPADLTDLTWPAIAAAHGVGLEPPLPPTQTVMIQRIHEDQQWGDVIFEFVAPAHYELVPEIVGQISYWGPNGVPNLRIAPPAANVTPHPNGWGDGHLDVKLNATGGGDRCAVTIMRNWEYRLAFVLQATAHRRKDVFSQWQARAWTQLRDAAFAAHQAQVARMQVQRDELWTALAGKDTLSLRRLEREELLRQTLYWIIGADFDPTPPVVSKPFMKLVTMEQNQVPDTQPGEELFRKLNAVEWSTLAGFGDFVKFIHHAVEWENLLYFLYPYFWGSDDLAREKLLFEHPDPLHRDFLRAGYARVVVPIRPGFESQFTELLDTGLFSGAPGGSPYMTIAEEVAAFARTNYAGVPPANPEKHARPLLYPQQRKTWDLMQQVIVKLEAWAATHNGAYPATLASLAGGPFKDAWNNELTYTNPGSGNDYDLVSYGADGQPGGDGLNADISAGAGASLMASWFEYTPTSALDIAIDPPLGDIA